MTSIVINEYGGVFLKDDGIVIEIGSQAKIFDLLRCMFIVSVLKNMVQEGSILFRRISSFQKFYSLILRIPEIGKYGMFKIRKKKPYSGWKPGIGHPLIQVF